MEADSDALEEMIVSVLLLAGVEPVRFLSDWATAVVWIWCEDDANTGLV